MRKCREGLPVRFLFSWGKLETCYGAKWYAPAACKGDLLLVLRAWFHIPPSYLSVLFGVPDGRLIRLARICRSRHGSM